ncbi:MAG: hypothetical protein RIR26_190 [Pseudomonadota bacterium]|jgi:hypothetical protein
MVELLVGSAVTLLSFSAVFKMLTSSRQGLHALSADGHHIHFETFASARLKLFFSKVLQWSSQLSGDSEKSSDSKKRAYKYYCSDTSNYAYAGAPLPFDQFTPEVKEILKIVEKNNELRVVTKKGRVLYDSVDEEANDIFVAKDEDGNPTAFYDSAGNPVFDQDDSQNAKTIRRWKRFLSSENGRGKFWLNKTEIPYQTMVSDMRMSLSTLSYAQLNRSGSPWKRNGLLDKWNEDFDFQWGAMVPFYSGGSGDSNASGAENGDIRRVNKNLFDFCSPTSGRRPAQGDGARLCQWVDWCSSDSFRGNNPNPAGDNIPLLVWRSLDTTQEILDARRGTNKEIVELFDDSSFRMCFAFSGNLFSKTGVFGGTDTVGTGGYNGIDHPASLGMAVASVRLVDARFGQEMSCAHSIMNLNRSLRVQLQLFTVLNADKPVSSKKQIVHSSVKELTSEKLAMERPNCNNRQMRAERSRKNSDGLPICIADPIFHYVCSKDCLRYSDSVPLEQREPCGCGDP